MPAQRDIKNIERLPIDINQKSKRAFLVDGLGGASSEAMPYHVDEWDFSSSSVTGIRNSFIVSFKETNPDHVEGIQDALYKFYHHSKNNEDLPLSVTMVRILKIALQKVAHCLGGTNWCELDSSKGWKSFIYVFKNSHYSKCSKYTIVPMVNALNRLKLVGEIQSFVDSEAIFSCLQNTIAKQHVALPHKLYQRVMNHAIHIVEKYHPYRDGISDVMRDAYNILARAKAGEKFVTSGRGSGRKLSMTNEAIQFRAREEFNKFDHGIPDFKVDLSGAKLMEIMISCLVVIQGFSGVRIGEALSFNKNSVGHVMVNGKKVTTLTGETTKGNGSIPKVVSWQSHYIAQTALELAYDMMASTRELYLSTVEQKMQQGEAPEIVTHMRRQLASAFILPAAFKQKGNNYLFQPQKNFTNFVKRLNYKATVEDVEEFNMLNPTREDELKVGGSCTSMSSHALRRTFAVFFVRYGFGTPAGIKFQFKHQNINMSGYYANNAVLAQMNDLLMDDRILEDLKEAGIDMGIDAFDEIYNQSEHLSGAKGEEIVAERMKKLQAGESIIMTREEIEENIRRGNFHIIQLPSGAYCTNGSCDRVCGTQPFRAEIKECEHKVVTDKGAKSIAKQRERLIAKFKSFNTGDPVKSSILIALKQKIQMEEITLRKHRIPYTPFDDVLLNDDC